MHGVKHETTGVDLGLRSARRSTLGLLGRAKVGREGGK